MQPSYAVKNIRDLIKNPRIRNNINLLSATDIINKTILNVTAGRVTRKNDSRE